MQFKSSIIFFSIIAVLFMGCGGSGGGSAPIVDDVVIEDPVDQEPIVTIETTYDDVTGISTKTTTVTALDGVVTITAVSTYLDKVIETRLTVIDLDGTVTETVTDEVNGGDGITLDRVAVTVVKPGGEKIRTVTTTDPDGVKTVITTNSKEFSVSRFTAVHSLDLQVEGHALDPDPELDGQVFDKVTAIIEFTNDSSEPIYITESYFEVGTCGGPYTDIDALEFGWTDYDTNFNPGDLIKQGPDSAPLYRRLTTGFPGPCDLYGDGHRIKFIVETVINNEVVIILEAETFFTVAPII